MSSFSSVFSIPQRNNLQHLYEKILHQCKDEILKNRMITIPNLITNNKKFPLYGLHSTTYDALERIYEEGFNANQGTRLGIKHEDPMVALFTIPFSINYEELMPNIGSNPNITVTISNGIARQLHIDSGSDLTFPIILCCFSNDNALTIKGDWIESRDNKNIYIVGHFDIKIKKNETFEKYLELNNSKNKSNQSLGKKYKKMLKLDYTIEPFQMNERFIKKNTIPIAIISDHNGGKSNKTNRRITRKRKKTI
jgi:hypothetical protein